MSIFLPPLALGYTAETIPVADSLWRDLAAFICREPILISQSAQLLYARDSFLPRFDARFHNSFYYELQIWRYLDDLAAADGYYGQLYKDGLEAASQESGAIWPYLEVHFFSEKQFTPGLIAMHALRRSNAAIADPDDFARSVDALTRFWAKIYPCEWQNTNDILYYAADPNAVQILPFVTPLYRFVPNEIVLPVAREMETATDAPTEECVWEAGVALFRQICKAVADRVFVDNQEFARFAECEWPFLNGWFRAIEHGEAPELRLIAGIGAIARAWLRAGPGNVGQFSFDKTPADISGYFREKIRALGLPETEFAECTADYLSEISGFPNLPVTV
jgi:hypothetical protein